ncbi:MAG: hypothetical protein P8179_12295 [Candidatus Thiodiazotropha sp.]
MTISARREAIGMARSTDFLGSRCPTDLFRIILHRPAMAMAA